MVAIDA